MSRARYIYRNVRSVPPSFKLAVYEAAEERGVTMSDVIGEILGKHFGVKYVLSGEKSTTVSIAEEGEAGGDQFRVRIPPALSTKIWRESRSRAETESSVILGVIADSFGLEHTPVKLGRKRAAV